MKKTLNIRNLIIVMLCITIICMGVGFAYLAIKLENKNNEQKIFDVSIVKVQEETPVKGGITSPAGTKEIINDKKTVNFNFTLYTPQDELAYTITIKNTGTLPVKITKLLTTPDYINDGKAKDSIHPVTITHNNIENKILEPEEEVKIKLVVAYNMSNNVRQMSIPYQITVLATSPNK